jgi:ATP-dependent RNA helicase RhlE
MLFEELGLNTHVLDALKPLGYTEPTPIQGQTIPLILEGRDVLGVAQTGTGKTAAFALPIVNQLAAGAAQGDKRRIRALILSPTRELATQIYDNIRDYSAGSPLRSVVIFGGVSQHRQVDQLRRGVDIVVATPGRLLDLVDQGFIHLNQLTHLVLDEADTMLDMGFIHDIRKIIKLLPTERQSLFFSATMPDNIVQLADTILTDPVRVEVARVSSAAETVNQLVYFACQKEKRDLLVDILKRPEVETALVFTRTKYGADKVVRYLNKEGIKAEAIHGNKSQPQRDRAMNGFRQGKINVLVATDIAARGIDVDALSHVINFEIPNISETYVHRIGRTGRAGLTGHAISLCNEDEERTYLRDIQKLIQRELPTERYGNYPLELGEVGMQKPARHEAAKEKPKKQNNRGGNNRSRPAAEEANRGSGGNRGNRGEGENRKPRNGGNQPNRREGGGQKRRMGERRTGGSGEQRQASSERPSRNNARPKRDGEGRRNEPADRKPRNEDSQKPRRNESANRKPRNAQPKPRRNDAEPRQFGRSTPAAAAKEAPKKPKGFFAGFFGFGKRED